MSDGSQPAGLFAPGSVSLIIALVQIRLIGGLLVVRFLSRALILIVVGFKSSVVAVYPALIELCNWLITLPLGLALYFLGAGQNRLPNEQNILIFCYRALRPLAVATIALIPLLVTLSLHPSWSDVLSDSRQNDSVRIVTAVGLSAVTGAGLYLLHYQMATLLSKYHVTIQAYFGSRVVTRHRKHHSRMG